MSSAFGGKTAGAADQITQLALHHADLAHEGFEITFAQIGFQGGGDVRFMPVHSGLQLFQHGDAEVHRQGGPAVKKFTLIF